MEEEEEFVSDRLEPDGDDDHLQGMGDNIREMVDDLSFSAKYPKNRDARVLLDGLKMVYNTSGGGEILIDPARTRGYDFLNFQTVCLRRIPPNFKVDKNTGHITKISYDWTGFIDISEFDPDWAIKFENELGQMKKRWKQYQIMTPKAEENRTDPKADDKIMQSLHLKEDFEKEMLNLVREIFTWAKQYSQSHEYKYLRKTRRELSLYVCTEGQGYYPSSHYFKLNSDGSLEYHIYQYRGSPPPEHFENTEEGIESFYERFSPFYLIKIVNSMRNKSFYRYFFDRSY